MDLFFLFEPELLKPVLRIRRTRIWRRFHVKTATSVDTPRFIRATKYTSDVFQVFFVINLSLSSTRAPPNQSFDTSPIAPTYQHVNSLKTSVLLLPAGVYMYAGDVSTRQPIEMQPSDTLLSEGVYVSTRQLIEFETVGFSFSNRRLPRRRRRT